MMLLEVWWGEYYFTFFVDVSPRPVPLTAPFLGLGSPRTAPEE
jgi:hypothetical protein